MVRLASAATRASTSEGMSSRRGAWRSLTRKTLPAVEDWIYEYGLLDEFAINAYWTERYAECVDACDRLLSEGKLPAEKRDRVLKNKNFAISKLQEIAALSSPEVWSFHQAPSCRAAERGTWAA